jgi:ribosome-associated translation inhibitor RaiA
MIIQINTDNHIHNTESFTAELTEGVEKRFRKYKTHITRVEVFFRDENSSKGGVDDKKCSIEARLEGMKPIAASHNASTLREAFSGASKKVERLVHDYLDKLKDKH